MALTPCVPCDCISANIPNDKFKQDIETILCGILGGTGGSQATFVTGSVAGAAGGVPTTGVKLIENTGNMGKQISINNTTDRALLISLDDGVTYGYPVAATTGSLVIDLGGSGLYTAKDIYAKAVGSNTTSGTLTGMVTIG